MAGFLNALGGAGLLFIFILLYNHFSEKKPEVKPVPLTHEQIVQNEKDRWKKANDRAGRDIEVWVDTKRKAICYIFHYGQGTGAVGGISCLPQNQVQNSQ